MQAVANRRRRRLETKTVGGGGLTGCSRQNKVSRGLEVKVSAAADIRLKVNPRWTFFVETANIAHAKQVQWKKDVPSRVKNKPIYRYKEFLFMNTQI